MAAKLIETVAQNVKDKKCYVEVDWDHFIKLKDLHYESANFVSYSGIHLELVLEQTKKKQANEHVQSKKRKTRQEESDKATMKFNLELRYMKGFRETQTMTKAKKWCEKMFTKAEVIARIKKEVKAQAKTAEVFLDVKDRNDEDW